MSEKCDSEMHFGSLISNRKNICMCLVASPRKKTGGLKFDSIAFRNLDPPLNNVHWPAGK